MKTFELKLKVSDHIQFTNDETTIKVYLLRSSGGAFKIGIDAPSDIKVLRSELYQEPQIQYDEPSQPKRK